MPSKRFKIEKLVRDNSGRVIEQRGDTVFERILTQDNEYLALLKEKLREESTEIINAQNKSELIEEIADVLEVMYAFASLYEFTMEDVEKKRIEKQATYGGFKGRVYAQWVEAHEGGQTYQKMMANPEKYPEIPME